MTKLLILGFSCTDTEDGYAAYLVQKLKVTNPDLGVLRCALGGLAPPVVPGVFKTLITEDPAVTHVLYEISTSIYAWLEGASADQARDIIRDLICTAMDKGVAPAFLILHRGEQRPLRVDLTAIIEEEAQAADLTCLNLADHMEQIFGRGWQTRLYRDDVHTNEAGGRSQAGLCLPVIRHFLRRALPDMTRKPRPSCRYTAQSILDFCESGRATGVFARKDYRRTYVDLAETDTLRIDLGDTRRVLGLSFVMGPMAGNFAATLVQPDGKERTHVISAIDERSYYQRIGFRSFNSYAGQSATALILQFHDRAEDLRLLKGARDPFPTRLRLADIFFIDPA